LIATTICAKPHVAAFIQTYFCRKVTIGHIVKLPKSISSLYNAVGHYATVEFQDRLTEAPDGMVLFKACLPKPYHNHYLSQQFAADFGRSMEDFFWREFKEYLLLHIYEYNLYKDHVIKDFMSRYGITESMYPIGHFRRQCTRMKIRGLKQPVPDIRPRIHRSIPDQMCMQMYRVYRDRQMSARVIADHYNLHTRAVERIIKKIKEKRFT